MFLGVRFVDLNGDEKADLVYGRLTNKDERLKGAYINTGSGWKSSPEYIPPRLIVSDDDGDLGVRFVELNGDGMVDFVFYRYISEKDQPKGAFINTGMLQTKSATNDLLFNYLLPTTLYSTRNGCLLDLRM
jgi:hypothetical protein